MPTRSAVDSVCGKTRSNNAVPRASSTNLRVAEAVHCVIVHHSDCLHEGVADGGTHELKTAARQVFAHRVGFARACRHLLQGPPDVALRRAVDKFPDVAVERAAFVLDD